MSEDQHKKNFDIELNDSAIIIRKTGHVEVIAYKPRDNDEITDSEELALAFTLVLNNAELYEMVMENYENVMLEAESENEDIVGKELEIIIENEQTKDRVALPFNRTEYGNYGFDNLN